MATAWPVCPPALARLDGYASGCLQRMSLPALIETLISYPDGELGFGKDTTIPTFVFTLLMAQAVHGCLRGFLVATPLIPGLALMLSSTALTILLKDVVVRQRPDPVTEGAGARTPAYAAHGAVSERVPGWPRRAPRRYARPRRAPRREMRSSPTRAEDARSSATRVAAASSRLGPPPTRATQVPQGVRQGRQVARVQLP